MEQILTILKLQIASTSELNGIAEGIA